MQRAPCQCDPSWPDGNQPPGLMEAGGLSLPLQTQPAPARWNLACGAIPTPFLQNKEMNYLQGN